ncbi:GntR family transcriptional regulator [Streptomyces sp. NPDC054995]
MTGSVHRRHHDIADDLRHQITTGSIKPGECLPSEAGLAARYRVSTVTLRRALAVLQGEGLVEKIHGKGNYVRHPRRKIMYVGGWGTLDPWTAAEPTLRITVRSTTVPASVHLTTLLKVPTGSPLAEYTCLSLEQGSPHGLARISAVLAITRIATDTKGRVVEAALLAFPGDRLDAVFTAHHVLNERPTQG